jgi:hypothetical protein
MLFPPLQDRPRYLLLCLLSSAQLAEPSDDGTIARACDDVDGKVPVRR